MCSSTPEDIKTSTSQTDKAASYNLWAKILVSIRCRMYLLAGTEPDQFIVTQWDYTFSKWSYFALQHPRQINLLPSTAARVCGWWKGMGVVHHCSDGFSPAFDCNCFCWSQTPPKDKDKTSHCHRALPLTLEWVKLWANALMCWVCDLRCHPDVFSGPWWCTQLSQKKMKIEAFNRKPTGNLFPSNYGCCSLITIAQGPTPSGP